jgi:plastin-1
LSITRTLSALNKTGGNRPISDTDILKWANATAAKKAGSRPIRSFKDPALTTGIFLLDLLEGIKPGIVDPTLVQNVHENGDYEERKQNGSSSAHKGSSLTDCDSAKLAISIARKANALIFLVPEDIVDVRPRLVSASGESNVHMVDELMQIMTFVGSLMAIAQ